MTDENAPRREQLDPPIQLSAEELMLLESYRKAWPRRLEAGFKRDNPFFAWLMIATRPTDEWPAWCKEYLVEVANRILKAVSTGDSYHGVRPRFNFDDYRKAFELLGIDGAARKWNQAFGFWAEHEYTETELNWMAEAWDTGAQFSQSHLIAHDEYVEEIHRFIRENAEKQNNSRLDYGSVIAKEGVEFDWTRGWREYETYASMLRAMRNRRKWIKKEMVEHGARPGMPGRPSRPSKA